MRLILEVPETAVGIALQVGYFDERGEARTIEAEYMFPEDGDRIDMTPGADILPRGKVQ